MPKKKIELKVPEREDAELDAISSKLEEMVHCMAGSEYHSGMVKNIDMLLSELLGAERINTYKRLENELYAIFVSQVKIGRLTCCRLRLRYKNLLNFQSCTV